MRRYGVAVCLAFLLASCGSSSLRPFPNKEPMWRDPDKRVFDKQPEEYYSPFVWDGANQLIFRPISRFFAVDPAGEAVNVNALDEVADSSWFTNRIGRYGMTPERAAQGACEGEDPPDPSSTWTVKAAKPNGFNPGFFIKTKNKKRYLIKFDGVIEGMRPTAADMVSSRLFYAAGYNTPCNRVVYFDRKILKIDPEAKSENERGDKVPMTDKDLDKVFTKALRLKDGRYRASASLFVEGKPIGPWTYEGRRSDDPNDVVNHEDRRDLRGLYVMASWLQWYDSREANTMATFVGEGGKGYVRHYMLDTGNAYGTIWEPPMMNRRIGQSYYLDVPYILEDFVTLGTIERPWDRARHGKTGKIFAYYDDKEFVPDKFRTGYPNPAFVRRSERDAAWMARTIARISEDHVRAIVKIGELQPFYEQHLLGVLLGRRDKILRRYLSKLSPLAWPQVVPSGNGSALCLEDLAVLSKIARPDTRTYTTWAWQTTDAEPIPISRGRLERGHWVCLGLPRVEGATAEKPQYLVVDLVAASEREKPTLPARVHLYHFGGREYRVVGLERPYDDAPPTG